MHEGLLPRSARRRSAIECASASLSSEATMVVAGAVGVALLWSTQILAQPFVWTDFPIAAIAAAWARLARNRLVVALCIAAAIVLVRTRPVASIAARSTWIAAAIAVGAIVGELMLVRLGYERGDVAWSASLPRVIRWCGIATVVAVLFHLYGRAAEARAAVHDATLRSAQIERRAVESRLQLLRAQIEPHFLFNTLATIRQLHRREPSAGQAMLSDFIGYLKAAMPTTRADGASLREELDLVAAYFGLVEVRMSGRLTSSIEADPTLEDHPFPPLSLATLVENAIKHGIVPSPRGGHVAVTVCERDGLLEASVVDDGVGLSDLAGGSGIGLSNTRARLASLHGPRASLSLMHHVPHGVRATIRIPL